MEYEITSWLPRGFRDTLPTEMAIRRHVVARIEAICKLHGFDPLDTPAVHHAYGLDTGDPEYDDSPDEDVFALEDTDGRWLALRVELTPCLMRALAENCTNIRLPLRCYQFGTVWRRRTGKLDRRRALEQFDIDVVGIAAPIPEAELCSLICAVLDGLGFVHGEYHIRAFNRKVLAGLLQLLGYQDPPSAWGSDGTVAPILSAMDAVRSHGLEEVRKMLVGALPDSWGNDLRPGLSKKDADAVLEFLKTLGGDRTQVVSQLRDQLQHSPLAIAGITELAAMHACLDALGIESQQVVVDPSFVRGPSFYEGTTLEVVIDVDPASTGARFIAGKERLRRAVAFGGRYSSAVSIGNHRRAPAVGVSFDLDRLMLRIKHGPTDPAAPVVVTLPEPNQTEEYLKMIRDLRMAGVGAELAHVEGRFGRQIGYADRRGALLAVICGGDEFAKGHVLIKDLRKGNELSVTIRDRNEWLRQSRAAQVPVPRDEMVATVRRLLDRTP